MVVKDIERDDVDYLSRSLGAIPVAHIDNLTEEKLGSAEWIGEDKLDNDTNILKIKGPP